MRIPGFVIPNQLVCDPMHCLWLGVAKTLYTLILKDGKPPAAALKARKKIDHIIQRIRLPSEFQRMIYAVDTATYKANEWRNVMLFATNTMCSIIRSSGGLAPDKKYAQAKCLADYNWLCRALLLDQYWYEQLKEAVTLPPLFLTWYLEYEQCFKVEKCLPNIHLFASHLYDWREKAELPDLSAEKFEAKFATNKRQYAANSMNEGKQIMLNGKHCLCNKCLVSCIEIVC